MVLSEKPSAAWRMACSVAIASSPNLASFAVSSSVVNGSSSNCPSTTDRTPVSVVDALAGFLQVNGMNRVAFDLEVIAPIRH